MKIVVDVVLLETRLGSQMHVVFFGMASLAKASSVSRIWSLGPFALFWLDDMM